MQVSTGTDPRELALDLTAFFRYVVTCSEGEFLQQVSELELSLTELKTLSLLTEADEPLSVKAVAERLGISLPTASRAVDPLVRRNLVVRKEDSDDRRIKRVQLSSRGRTITNRLMATRAKSFERMLEDFSEPQRRKLAAAMDALRDVPEISRFRSKDKK